MYKIILYYKHSITPTCFDHSHGHLQGGVLTNDGCEKTLQKYVNLCTNVKD